MTAKRKASFLELVGSSNITTAADKDSGLLNDYQLSSLSKLNSDQIAKLLELHKSLRENLNESEIRQIRRIL